MKKKKAVVIPNYCGFTEKEMHGLYRVKSSPWFWRNKAEGLKYAADLLWPVALKRLDKVYSSLKNKKNVDFSALPPEIFSTAKGLLGFSIECLFKAGIIRDNPHFVDNGQQNKKLKTHNLVKLAEIGKITLNHEKRHTCQTLTDAMYVDFRYPTDRQVTFGKGIIRIGRSIIDVGNELYERLHATVNQIHLAKGGVITFDQSTEKFVAAKKARRATAKKVVRPKK